MLYVAATVVVLVAGLTGCAGMKGPSPVKLSGKASLGGLAAVVTDAESGEVILNAGLDWFGAAKMLAKLTAGWIPGVGDALSDAPVQVTDGTAASSQ